MQIRERSHAQGGRLAVSAALVGLLLFAAAGAFGEETGVRSDASGPSESALAEEIDALGEESQQIDREVEGLNDSTGTSPVCWSRREIHSS